MADEASRRADLPIQQQRLCSKSSQAVSDCPLDQKQFKCTGRAQKQMAINIYNRDGGVTLPSHATPQVLRPGSLSMMQVQLNHQQRLWPVSCAVGEDRPMLHLPVQLKALLPASSFLPHQKQEQGGNAIKQPQSQQLCQPVQGGA